jgi:hypothetical protein
MQNYNNQHNDINYNDIQHEDIKYNDVLLNDIQHDDIMYNDILLNDIQLSNIQLNDIQLKDIQLNGIQLNDISLTAFSAITLFNDTQHNSKKERYFVKQICHGMFRLVCSLTKHSSSSCLGSRVSPERLCQ